ncbi:YeeE/YedE thiosulfate transporter family protein [Moellerella wisconsensis]|uniref:YeeE/YedE family protein n=1 Tax=Moellerella wisconsensis TaxID=158849 RepID=UPI0025AF841E|nr:YeeE/YedE thiosulfate transporter family protein [Moellerella wisconsensis]WJW81157.1 YeeE/YedE thiosulfate transporter family protein [Moellerella wisconsensis]
MTIDWANFTPLSAAMGGVFIGVAVAILILSNGRIAGISGIIGGIIKPIKGEFLWKVAFIIGILIAPLLFSWWFFVPVIHIAATTPLLIIGGLLVGYGTRLGSGCTSGHGICGMARLSKRSLVAMLIFMISAFVTVAIINNINLGG